MIIKNNIIDFKRKLYFQKGLYSYKTIKVDFKMPPIRTLIKIQK